MYSWSQFQQRQTKSRGGSSFPACRHVAHTGFESSMPNSWYCQMKCNHLNKIQCLVWITTWQLQEPAPPQYTPSAQQTVTNADFQVDTLYHINLFVFLIDWLIENPGKCFSHWWKWKPQLTLLFLFPYVQDLQVWLPLTKTSYPFYFLTVLPSIITHPHYKC